MGNQHSASLASSQSLPLSMRKRSKSKSRISSSKGKQAKLASTPHNANKRFREGSRVRPCMAIRQPASPGTYLTTEHIASKVERDFLSDYLDQQQFVRDFIDAQFPEGRVVVKRTVFAKKYHNDDDDSTCCSSVSSTSISSSLRHW